MNKQVIIIGCGGHGRVIADIVSKSGDIVRGFLDDNVYISGVIGTPDECYKYPDCTFVVGIGDNNIRQKMAEKYPSLDLYTAIHPTAVIGENVKIGKGTVIMPRAVINANSVVGEHSIINTGAIIEHDNVLSDFVHISPGAVLCGTVNVGKNVHIGAGAVVRNNITIKENVTVGAGAVVIKNLEAAKTYVGIPAKELKKI